MVKTGTREKATARKEATVTVPVRELGKKKVEQMEAPAYLLVSASPQLQAQVVLTGRQRERIRRAHTKERAEVRGGGAKPWRQKGTGRARHGSRRSPLWVGGGVTFGPRSRRERRSKVQRKMARRALAGALSDHVRAGTLTVVRFGSKKIIKTKEVVGVLKGERGVLIIGAEESGLYRAARNIQTVVARPASQVTVADVLAARVIWVDEKSLPTLERRVV